MRPFRREPTLQVLEERRSHLGRDLFATSADVNLCDIRLLGIDSARDFALEREFVLRECVHVVVDRVARDELDDRDVPARASIRERELENSPT